MKKFITGIVLLSLPLFASAKLIVVSEVLIGQSQNKIKSSRRHEIQDEVSQENYSSSLNANSFGFRLGIKVSDNISFELSNHKHGSTIHYRTISFSRMDPTGSIILPPEFDTIIQTKTSIDLDSTRLGVKGEIQLIPNLSINARLGFAHWKYQRLTPQKITNFGASSINDKSGNDIYYSLGGEYQFTENFYVGLEYSLLKIKESNEINSEVNGLYQHEVKDFSLVLGWEF